MTDRATTSPPKNQGQDSSGSLLGLGIVDTFLSYESAIKRYLTRFLYRSEDIDEAAQETFLMAFDAEKKRSISSPKAYLFQVAKSIALRELTRKSTKMTDYLEDALLKDDSLLGGNDSLEDEVMAQQKIKNYCAAIASMPLQCRKVFLMRKLQAKSHREIAEALNVSVSAVEKHIANGVKKFDLYMQQLESPSTSGSKGAAPNATLPREQL